LNRQTRTDRRKGPERVKSLRQRGNPRGAEGRKKKGEEMRAVSGSYLFSGAIGRGSGGIVFQKNKGRRLKGDTAPK